MSRRAIAVVGAGWGDEGKGRIVDFLVGHHPGLPPCAMVVRHNGGAQAGHTVQVGAERLAFRTFSSGTLHGVPTYLGPEFVVDPAAALVEREELTGAVGPIDLLVDPAARIGLPFDGALCRAVEEARGATRHGSCGYGIGETVERNLSGSTLSYGRAFETDERELGNEINRMQVEYVPARADALRRAAGVSSLPVPKCDGREVARTIKDFCALAGAPATTLPIEGRDDGLVVFEGAQGLLLDEKHRFFPHVTRSATGLRNVVPLCKRLGIRMLDVLYVMRSYSTRHGAGQFPTVVPGMSFDDPTNVPNPWQGTLRFGTLDTMNIRDAIEQDLGEAEGGLPDVTIGRVGIALNCLDQFGGRAMLDRVERLLRLPVVIAGWGPRREQVMTRDPEWFRGCLSKIPDEAYKS